MDNSISKYDTYAIPGPAHGGASYEKMQNRAYITIPPSEKSIYNAGSRIASAVEWHFSAFTDEHRSPKYSIDPNIIYLGNGSISIIPRLGMFALSAAYTSPGRPVFSVDQSASEMYSESSRTTLGSLDIDTLDGYQLNPVSKTIPSTPYSPTKPWIQKLFPTLSVKSLFTLAILELVQEALLSAEDTTYSVKKIEKDLGAIIIDRADLEERFFAQS